MWIIFLTSATTRNYHNLKAKQGCFLMEGQPKDPLSRWFGRFDFRKFFGEFPVVMLVGLVFLSISAQSFGPVPSQGGFFVAEATGGNAELDEQVIDFSSEPNNTSDFNLFVQAPLSPFDNYEPQDLILVEQNLPDQWFLASPLNPQTGLGQPQDKAPRTYVVRQYDTISHLAEIFGVSSSTIIWANNLTNPNYLKPGQELIIPPTTGVLVKVKNGDTAQSLATKYRADSEKIIAFNSLPADGRIPEGRETIMVPDGWIAPPPPPPRPRSLAVSSRPPAQLGPVSGYFTPPTTGRRVRGLTRYHRGVDIANHCGTPVYASASGQVVRADGVGWNGGFGKVVVIIHPNGTRTLYAHLSSIAVSQGQSVSQGAYIGAIGTTGRSSGCHLHFEVHGARNPF